MGNYVYVKGLQIKQKTYQRPIDEDVNHYRSSDVFTINKTYAIYVLGTLVCSQL